jgi:serine phosphatase RsbU (regulator of sigma subunit)
VIPNCEKLNYPVFTNPPQKREVTEGLTAEEIKTRIMESAFQHYGKTPFDDDVTLIVGRVR